MPIDDGIYWKLENHKLFNVYYAYDKINSTLDDCKIHCEKTNGCDAFEKKNGGKSDCRIYGGKKPLRNPDLRDLPNWSVYMRKDRYKPDFIAKSATTTKNK